MRASRSRSCTRWVIWPAAACTRRSYAHILVRRARALEAQFGLAEHQGQWRADLMGNLAKKPVRLFLQRLDPVEQAVETQGEMVQLVGRHILTGGRPPRSSGENCKRLASAAAAERVGRGQREARQDISRWRALKQGSERRHEEHAGHESRLSAPEAVGRRGGDHVGADDRVGRIPQVQPAAGRGIRNRCRPTPAKTFMNPRGSTPSSRTRYPSRSGKPPPESWTTKATVDGTEVDLSASLHPGEDIGVRHRRSGRSTRRMGNGWKLRGRGILEASAWES